MVGLREDTELSQSSSFSFLNVGMSEIHRKTSVPETLFYKKETLPQVFSFEFCKIFMKTFFNRTPQGSQVPSDLGPLIEHLKSIFHHMSDSFQLDIIKLLHEKN